MTVTTDWTQDAAEEIIENLSTALDITFAEWMTKVVQESIRKHCPFKQDVAYREVTAEDYPRDRRHNDDID